MSLSECQLSTSLPNRSEFYVEEVLTVALRRTIPHFAFVASPRMPSFATFLFIRRVLLSQ
jgi:hypothetical protein